MFGNREQRVTPIDSTPEDNIDFAGKSGRILQSHFDDKMGGYWQMDLSWAYDGVRCVTRTVVHLFPGFVAVLDEGTLDREEDISLRWHTIETANLKSDGTFLVASQGVGLAGSINVLDGNLVDHRLRRHQYEAPFDRDRMGDLLEQRREPYVETRIRDKHFRVLTLFALIPDVTVPSEWVLDNEGWNIETADGECKVFLEAGELRVVSPPNQHEWRVSL